MGGFMKGEGSPADTSMRPLPKFSADAPVLRVG
jgi:hypothetical protein